jgi:hypothetical protein
MRQNTVHHRKSSYCRQRWGRSFERINHFREYAREQPRHRMNSRNSERTPVRTSGASPSSGQPVGTPTYCLPPTPYVTGLLWIPLPVRKDQRRTPERGPTRRTVRRVRPRDPPPRLRASA